MFEDANLQESPASAIDLPAANPVRSGTGSVNESLLSSGRARRERFHPQIQGEQLDPNWLKHCLEAAVQSAINRRHIASLFPGSPAALARLAQAELAAGSIENAVDAAVQCIALAKQSASGPGDTYDIGSVFGSVKVLIHCGRRDRISDMLSTFPSHPLLVKVKADLAADARDWMGAMSLLNDISSPEAHSLRGYLYLQLGKPEQALKQLRGAVQSLPSDAKVLMNMAIAFWRLGSSKKAVRFARQAYAVMPGDSEMLLSMLGFLIATGQTDAASREMERLRRAGVVQTPNLLVMRAKISLERNEVARGKALLNQAMHEYRRLGDKGRAAELQGNLTMLRLATAELSGDSARAEIKKALSRNPDSSVLIAIFADLLDTVTMARQLRPYVMSLPNDPTDHLALSARTRLAYLECRFDDASELSHQWSEADHFSVRAATLDFMLKAQVFDDFETAANLAIRALARFRWDPRLANEAAYVLALAGRANVARRALKQVTHWTSILKATSGLVEISDGNIDKGLRLYREAASLADHDADGQVVRALMTLHQTSALHRLGVLSTENRMELLAKALPPIELPEDWEVSPQFRLLYDVARRHEWSWPMVIS